MQGSVISVMFAPVRTAYERLPYKRHGLYGIASEAYASGKIEAQWGRKEANSSTSSTYLSLLHGRSIPLSHMSFV